MKEKHVNQDVEIVVMPSATRAACGVRETNRIQQTVREYLLTSMETYHKVQVTAKQGPEGRPQILQAFMLRAYSYTADIVELSVDADYNVKSINTSCTGVEEEADETFAAVPPTGIVVGRPGPDMVFGTPVPEIPTAKAGVEEACRVAKSAGYKVVKLLGKDANVANYKKYLSGHLKAFGNIGHGWTGGIVLFDGNLTSAWVSMLPKTGLKPEVIYFNSCQVFNPPLQPAIMGTGARTFVGGKVNLQIGTSEKVFKCFWTTVLRKIRRVKMGVALTTCEKKHYPTVGAHGIGGDLGLF